MTAPELLALYSCHLPTSPGQAPKILKIRVKVLDTRELFKNRVDVKICPVAGEGEVWVAESSLTFDVPPSGQIEVVEPVPYGPEGRGISTRNITLDQAKKEFPLEFEVPSEDAPEPYPGELRADYERRTQTRAHEPIYEWNEEQHHWVRKPQDALGGTPICPECGAPIEWVQSVRDNYGAGYGWMHIVSSECYWGFEPRDAPQGQEGETE